MDKYTIVTTLCDKEKIANKIMDTLLEKRLVVGSQISKVHSKYFKIAKSHLFLTFL